MRKILIISLLFLFFDVKAQSFYQFHAGAGVNSFYTERLINKYNFTNRIGVGIGKQFSKRWTFKTGINLLNLHVYDYVNVGKFFQPNAGSSTVFEKTHIENIYGELPLFLQLDIIQKKKFDFYLYSGVSFNNLVYIYETRETDRFGSFDFSFEVDLVANVGVGVQFNVRNGSKFFIQPNFNYKVVRVDYSVLISEYYEYFFINLDFGIIKQF